MVTIGQTNSNTVEPLLTTKSREKEDKLARAILSRVSITKEKRYSGL